ncbi:MAG: hypothetical protein KGL42_07930 [Betaproteobacteria bacterium]|nr:hypothetical protein [Betaproteobacteria bacterium]
MQIIEISAGSQFIAAWELGRRIGALLHPTPNPPPLLVSLRKKITEAEPKHFRIEELSDADLLYLRAVWKKIDIPEALNMTREQWAQCKAAFQAAPDRPAWDLVAEFRDYVSEARSEQFRIANKHVQAMNALISSGALRAYDAELAPVQKVDGWGAQLRVEDARAYLAELGIELRESDGQRGGLGLIAAMNQSLAQQAVEALAAGYRPSEGPYRRTLPAGKRFFTIAEAAMEMALAVHPKQSDDPLTAKVKGLYLHEIARHAQGVYPTDEQWRELTEVWRSAGFPDPAFPMERYTFDAYALALSQSALGKTWALAPNLTSRETHAAPLRAATVNANAELLRQAIAAGTVVPLHPATKTPIDAASAGAAALIRRADLVKFAASLPEPIELVEPASESVPAQEDASSRWPSASGVRAIDAQETSVDTAERDQREREAGAREPLTNDQIAAAFGALWHGRQTLRQFLANRVPNWLSPAVAEKVRERDKRGRRWDPVKFAELLRDQKRVTAEQLNRAFRTRSELMPWLSSWQEAQSAFDHLLAD